ncbi:hypothetical protein OJF2_78160 [Aquisphaera giovannonii]|uniref:Uncharacterized protein n=1 Tax=Aquisphaera giovannonii TaxID=406548 RepID=A0A5B9WF42_9BACT|nr:hypothetical protein [Aquisphaera giovannonii]QEH39202.1 hypothetical protein OJF2_78160 [Aquisphaera giovannonii]
MDSHRLFVARVVVAIEERWFAPGTGGPPVRSERRHLVESFLFAAPDAEAAYEVAAGWLPGFSDSNHDGRGEETALFALGLHQLEELIPRLGELPSAAQEHYGIDLGLYDPDDVDADGVPLVRTREQLEVFLSPSSHRREEEGQIRFPADEGGIQDVEFDRPGPRHPPPLTPPS